MKILPNKYLNAALSAGIFISGAYALIISLYILNNLIFNHRIIDLQKIKAKAELRRVHLAMPSLVILARMQKEPDRIPLRLQEYADYFGAIPGYIENKDDAYAWQGYCYFLLGQPDQAYQSYQKAIRLNPRFFWHHHNQGIVFFKNREYTKAAAAFKNALQANPYLTLSYMQSFINADPLLMPWRLPHISNDELLHKFNDQLRRGYIDNYRLLIVSCYYLKDYQGMLDYALRALKSGLGQEDTLAFLAGVAAYELKRYEQSYNFFNLYLKANRNDPAGLGYLGLIYRALGKETLAADILRQADSMKAAGAARILNSPDAEIQIF